MHLSNIAKIRIRLYNILHSKKKKKKVRGPCVRTKKTKKNKTKKNKKTRKEKRRDR